MKLGINWGYWGAGPPMPPQEMAKLTKEAETLGYDTVWTAEAWGSDVFSPLAYIAAHTEKINLGTAICQMAARTPTAVAMHAVTLDHLSNGRMILGLGVSGPQVVEGWYGQPSNRPLARTREYIAILRNAFERKEHLSYEGEYYSHPYTGEGSVGLGKPLKIMTHPLRADLPIYIGAEGPKNIAQTVEIADGWLPLYYSPHRPEVYADSLKGMKPGFEIPVTTTVVISDDIPASLMPTRATLGFYIGGMGAKGQNYHTKLMSRMGYEKEALEIQNLFLEGKRDEAIALVPESFADEISLVGPPERIKERLEAWKESPVTMITVAPRNADDMRQYAEIFLG